MSNHAGVCSLIGGYWLAVKVLFAARSTAALLYCAQTYPQPHHIQAGLLIGTSLLDLPSQEPITGRLSSPRVPLFPKSCHTRRSKSQGDSSQNFKKPPLLSSTAEMRAVSAVNVRHGRPRQRYSRNICLMLPAKGRGTRGMQL